MNGGAALGESYFLSYSRSDEKIAMNFARELRKSGIAMWVDQLDIRPSEHWDRAIERAVRECRGLVVMLSPRSAASDNVADEISFAIDHGKSVLPVMIERCAPPLRITRMQVIDATSDFEQAVQQCICVLGGSSHLPPPRGPASGAQEGISDAAVIAAAKARLTPLLGPIASLLVDRNAARARSVNELYRLLAQHVTSATDRDQLMTLAGAPASDPAPLKDKPSNPSVPAEEVDRLVAILTRYLGPMAALVARRESIGAASPQQLKQRLAARIPREQERADFLRRAELG